MHCSVRAVPPPCTFVIGRSRATGLIYLYGIPDYACRPHWRDSTQSTDSAETPGPPDCHPTRPYYNEIQPLRA